MQTQNKAYNRITSQTDTPVDKNMAYKQKQGKYNNARHTQHHEAYKTTEDIHIHNIRHRYKNKRHTHTTHVKVNKITQGIQNNTRHTDTTQCILNNTSHTHTPQDIQSN